MAAPPERTLARALAVSRNTVAAAYELLRGDGLIERRQGSGTTVAPRRYSPSGEYKVNAMFLSLLESSTATIDLTCAINETAPLVHGCWSTRPPGRAARSTAPATSRPGCRRCARRWRRTSAGGACRGPPSRC
jgi:DNA-binding transcriptional MocR family regulator